MESIELDCPPGYPRPGDLIAGVIAGTGLPESEPVFMFFGCWAWEYDVPREKWEREIQPVIRPRIQALHSSGVIRYGSW